MIRYFNVLFVLVVLIGVAIVFELKRDAEQAAEHVADLKRQIAAEEEAISLLKAEWSLLNQPDRLQKLVARYNDYLELEPLAVEQIAEIDDLPTKPIQFDPVLGEDRLGGFAGGTVNIQ
ncbi:MAG: hypothetical protein ABJN26_09285 [Stappiaceae bacterium]